MYVCTYVHIQFFFRVFENLNRSKQEEKLPEVTEAEKQLNKEVEIPENSENLIDTSIAATSIADTSIAKSPTTTIPTTIENNLTFPQELPKSSIPEIAEMDVIQEHSADLSTLLTWLRSEPPLSQERLSTLCIEHSDFESALRIVQPSAKREGFATVPDVTWDDVGSLRNIRQELQMAILVSINSFYSCNTFHFLKE